MRIYTAFLKPNLAASFKSPHILTQEQLLLGIPPKKTCQENNYTKMQKLNHESLHCSTVYNATVH